MKRLIGLLGIGMAVFMPLVALAVEEDHEEKVALEKVPKPVLQAVQARFKGASMTGASKETEDGKLVYEVTIEEKGKDVDVDVTLTPEGEILKIEREIDAKSLPKASAKALEDKYPRATYKIVEEIIEVQKKQEKLAYYEVLLVTADKRTLEIEVTAEGRIANVEEKSGLDEGEDDDEGDEE
jgi:uncharacterized membrane protein YkoI